MDSCFFKNFSSNECGFSYRFPFWTSVVQLRLCDNDTSHHLKMFNVAPGLNEGVLISARAGLFAYDPNIRVCPAHRSSLGLGWRRSRLCVFPGHTGKSKPDRSLSLQMCKNVFDQSGTIVPVGGGICKKCREYYYKHMQITGADQLSDDFKLPQPLNRHLDSRTSHDFNQVESEINELQKNTDELPLNRKLDSETICSFNEDESENINDLQKDANEELVSSQSSVEVNSQGSNWSDTSSGRFEIASGILAVNSTLKNLSKGKVSPIKFQLRKPLEEVNYSTRRYLKRKAKEAINTLLENIAPNQSEKLLSLAFMDCKPELSKETETTKDLISVITHLYMETDNNYLRCQLLSLISSSEMHSKSELQSLIPFLTKHRIDQSRAHAAKNGIGSLPPEKKIVHRDRMDSTKLEHALAFIHNPNFLQICSYGTKKLQFDSGQMITIPQVVRTTCHSALVEMYKGYCKEDNFSPLSDASLYRILATCSAAKRTNLSGIDNILADGSAAIENILKTIEQLDATHVSKDNINDLKSTVNALKIFLKTEYKFHITEASSCPEHCMTLALCHPTDLLLQNMCSHDHDQGCDGCSLLEKLRHQMHTILQRITDTEIREDFMFSTNADFDKINEWRCHIVRTKNQEECRLNVLESLQSYQVLLVMDWAMKFLPLFYREKQSDFFGQKGLGWHVTVAIFRTGDGTLKHKTYTHLFNSVRQDWFAVASILEHTLKTIKQHMPVINEAFLRSDNAGCYHCGCLWLSLHGISQRTGIKICRYDFSETQSGKSICDAKIAHMRAKMKMFVASGENIRTPFDMQKAIMAGSGVVGCQCVVAEVDTSRQEMKAHRFKGVNQVSNLEFEGDHIITWHAYNMGIGKKIPRSTVIKQEQGSTDLTILSEPQEPNKPFGKILTKGLTNNVPQNSVIPEIFHCSEPGCALTFPTYHQLETHETIERHQTENISTYDKIRKRWTSVCYSNLEANRICFSKNKSDSSNTISSIGHNLQTGWAIKKDRKFIRFSANAKQYLRKRFENGETTGKKATPADVAWSMRMQREENGKFTFSREELLQPSQIASYFARLSVLSRKEFRTNNDRMNTISDDDLFCAVQAIEEEELKESLNSE